MRIEPSKKVVQNEDVPTSQERIEIITRKIAIAVAFISTFIFFFKILFF